MGDYIGRAIVTMVMVAFGAGVAVSIIGYFVVSWLSAHMTIGWI